MVIVSKSNPPASQEPTVPLASPTVVPATETPPPTIKLDVQPVAHARQARPTVDVQPVIQVQQAQPVVSVQRAPIPVVQVQPIVQVQPPPSAQLQPVPTTPAVTEQSLNQNVAPDSGQALEPPPVEKSAPGQSAAKEATEPEPAEESKSAPTTETSTPSPAMTPVAAPEVTETKRPVHRKRKSGGFLALLKSLNSIGLGKEKANFIENLAILLNSGLSVVDALKTLQVEIRKKPMKKIVQYIIEEVESGIALWRSMDNQRCFSPYALALIRIGEEAGSLSSNMEYLSVQQEKERSLRAKVKMAMIYPIIVLTLTIIITLGLAWFVLPQLVGVLLSLNAKLPLVTRIIIIIANFFRDYGSTTVPLFFLLSFIVAVLCKYTPLKGPAQQLVFKIPGIGSLARSATIARFGVILGSLLKAGVPLVESIRSLADVTDTIAYRRFFFRLADEVEVGQSFSSSFSRIKNTHKLLPISVQQLVVTGEKSGKIADMLLRIATIYEKKAEETAQKLPTILEPILLIFIGGLVGTIAFAVIVPIYSIVGQVGR